MQRRTFLSACTAGCAAAVLPASAAVNLRPRHYQRTLLVDAADRPLQASAVAPQHNYIFHYPYAATPCFLLNLGRPLIAVSALKTANAQSYDWPGGVGPQQAIVAYSAICAHKLTYPTRDISFISYRADATPSSKIPAVIHCCSEHSQYDPARGGRVVAGPAPQPLATILLEHDAAQDALYAVGTLGGELFDDFFTRFAFRLALDNGGKTGREPVGAQARVVELDNYCRQQVKC